MNSLAGIKLKEWGLNLSARTKTQLEIEDADTVTLALEKLKARPFEILVVDLKIPGLSGDEMGGLEVISESIKFDPLRPIIVITGYGSVGLARKTLTQGVFDFIEKSETSVDELVCSVQRAIDTRDEKIIRVGNPFIPMTGIEPTVFAGRTKELEFFEQRLNRALHTRFCEHFLVLGNWGIGKSTLLKEYKKICQSRGYLASMVQLESLQPNTKLAEAVRSILEGILRDLPYSVDRFKKVANFFDSIGINILGSGITVSRDNYKKELSPQALLHESLTKLWEDLKDKNEILVILLDDLDNFITVPEVFMTLKQTLSMDSITKTKILIGIASTPTSWLELTSIKRHHPLSRYFLSRVELGPLTEDEMREAIIKSLFGTGVSFSTDILKKVFEYTQGHPFEMQVLCYHLFNNQLSRRVEADMWGKALESTLKDLGIAIFDHLFNQASNEEAKVLRVIADVELPVSTKEIHNFVKECNVRISPNNIAKYLQRLVQKRLINKSARGLYTVPDRMFRAYVGIRQE